MKVFFFSIRLIEKTLQNANLFEQNTDLTS